MYTPTRRFVGAAIVLLPASVTVAICPEFVFQLIVAPSVSVCDVLIGLVTVGMESVGVVIVGEVLITTLPVPVMAFDVRFLLASVNTATDAVSPVTVDVLLENPVELKTPVDGLNVSFVLVTFCGKLPEFAVTHVGNIVAAVVVSFVIAVLVAPVASVAVAALPVIFRPVAVPAEILAAVRLVRFAPDTAPNEPLHVPDVIVPTLVSDDVTTAAGSEVPVSVLAAAVTVMLAVPLKLVPLIVRAVCSAVAVLAFPVKGPVSDPAVNAPITALCASTISVPSQASSTLTPLGIVTPVWPATLNMTVCAPVVLL